MFSGIMSLFLVGMRGSGKSTAGKLAAEALQVPFIDTDQVIEEQQGQSITHIFQEQGEGYFREKEKEIILRLLKEPGQLVATGGGCILDTEVRDGLKQTGRVVWLQASLPMLQKRIAESDRPSLTGKKIEDELATLWAAREELYRYCSTQYLSTDHLSPDEVAHVIQHLWSILPHHHLW